MTDSEFQKAFAKWTLDAEARRDSKGNLKIYNLPAGDGGGTFEVAGINDRYHPKAANYLKALIDSKQFSLAEDYAINYLESFQNQVDEWHPDEVVEGYLRCISFNRGKGGAAWILQYALKYGFSPSLYTPRLDTSAGQVTLKGSYQANPDELLPALLGARIVYERTKVTGIKGSRDESSQFWHGLFKRFCNDMTFAQSLKNK